MAYSVIDLQGNILTTGVTIYTVPANKNGNINNIKISNPTGAAFDVALYKVISSTPILIYSFNLEAGDILSDTDSYLLNPGTSIYAESSSNDVVYTVNGNEIDLIISS